MGRHGIVGGGDAEAIVIIIVIPSSIPNLGTLAAYFPTSFLLTVRINGKRPSVAAKIRLLLFLKKIIKWLICATQLNKQGISKLMLHVTI